MSSAARTAAAGNVALKTSLSTYLGGCSHEPQRISRRGRALSSRRPHALDLQAGNLVTKRLGRPRGAEVLHHHFPQPAPLAARRARHEGGERDGGEGLERGG